MKALFIYILHLHPISVGVIFFKYWLNLGAMGKNKNKKKSPFDNEMMLQGTLGTGILMIHPKRVMSIDSSGGASWSAAFHNMTCR